MAACRKGICKLVRFIAQLASLSTEHHFCFKEQLTDKLWLFRLSFLADIFSKKNFMENNYPYFFSPITKFKLSSENKNFGKHVSAIMSWTTSHT